MLVLDAIKSHNELLIDAGVNDPIDFNFIKQHGSSDPAKVIFVSL